MSTNLQGTPSGRIVSIDALRGFDMFWITGGATFIASFLALFNLPLFDSLTQQFHHVAWNGFRFYDLIFPLFVFIMGASMVFSFHKRIERGDSKKDLYINVVKRTLTLFILGLIHNGLFNFDFSNFRYAGVLQRFALCYFFASIIFINTNIKGQAIFAAAILILYWAAMALIPVPGFGAGVLTPEGSLAAFIDQQFLPGRFCCYEFGDNEGIMSTIPAVASTLLGMLTGHLLRSSFSQIKKVQWLLIAGISSLLLAKLWNFAFPINKNLWSSSFVLYAAGWSLLLLCLFYWLIDIRGYQKWAFPFIVIGLNPITIYVAQSLFDFSIIANIFIHGFVDQLGIFSLFFKALSVLSVKWLFLYFLYKKKIFLKA